MVVNSTTITCKTPAHAAGAVTVAVTTPAGTGSKATAFTYVAGTTALSLMVTRTKTGTAGKLTTSAATPTGTHLAVRILGTTEFYELGLGTSGTGHTPEPAPTGHGGIWPVATLAGHHIVAGKWTFHFEVSFTSGTVAMVLHARAYRKNGATFVQIGSDLTKSVTPVTGLQALVVTGTLPQATFATGTQLYIDAYLKGASTTPVTITILTGGTNRTTITTPGYV